MKAFEEKQVREVWTEQVTSSLKLPVIIPGIKGHQPGKSLVFLSLSSLANLGLMQSCDLLEELGRWEGGQRGSRVTCWREMDDRRDKKEIGHKSGTCHQVADLLIRNGSQGPDRSRS